MTQVTVKELALVVATPVERLLQQMREAGLPHSHAEQVVTDEEKQKLLAHLKSSHGDKLEEPSKITLKRKTTSTLRVAGSKTISVEVRKKKTFVTPEAAEVAVTPKREPEEKRPAEERVAAEAAAAAARQKPQAPAAAPVQSAPRRGDDAEEARLRAVAARQAAAEAAAAVQVEAAKPAAERAKDEARRAAPKRSEDDERRERKQAQHRPSLKEKAPAPRVAPRSTDRKKGSETKK